MRKSCPNYVFSLIDERTFSIEDLSYTATRASVDKTYSIEIPNHINIHLGVTKEEFRSITAEEVEKLKAEREKLNTDKLTEEVGDNGGLFNLPDFHQFITSLGAYIGLIFAERVIFLLCYPSRRRREGTAPTSNLSMGLLIFLALALPILSEVYAYQTHLKIRASAEQATLEIAELQQKMLDHSCNLWDLSRDYDHFLDHEGHYAVALTCALAKLKITCPCDSSDEYIPVVRENKLKHVEKWENSDCPRQNRALQQRAPILLTMPQNTSA